MPRQRRIRDRAATARAASKKTGLPSLKNQPPQQCELLATSCEVSFFGQWPVRRLFLSCRNFFAHFRLSIFILQLNTERQRNEHGRKRPKEILGGERFLFSAEPRKRCAARKHQTWKPSANDGSRDNGHRTTNTENAATRCKKFRSH